MHNDESVPNYFLRVDEIVNCMKNLGEEIKEAVVVEKVLRSLSSRFESKVSAIEEEEESNFVKNLQRGTGRFRGKLPFKCFACGRVGHYATKCPHKDKGKEPVRWNRKQNATKKSYYTHEDSDGVKGSMYWPCFEQHCRIYCHY